MIEPVEINFSVAKHLSEVRSKVVKAVVAKGGRIKINDDSFILAGFGSNLKVRLLGAMLAGIKSMPRDILVQMKEEAAQTHVSILVRNTFGFGSLVGVSERLQKLMSEDASSLKELLSVTP